MDARENNPLDDNALWDRSLTLLALALVVAATVFPLNVVCGGVYAGDWSWQQGRFDWVFFRNINALDFVRNIILFLTLGFAVTGMACRGRATPPRALLIATVAGAICSVIVEATQIFLPIRSPAMADILANSVGALIGGYGYLRFGAACFRLLTSLSVKLAQRRHCWLVTTFATLYILVVIALSVVQQQKISLSEWDETYPLAIGNEVTGDRPWQGHVAEVRFSAGIISESAIECLLSGGNDSYPCVTPGFDTTELAHYKISSADLVADQTDQSPPLAKMKNEDGVKPGQMWLQSTDGLSTVNRQIASSGKFTLFVEAKTANVQQSGPARVVTISESTGHRNLTLGQQQDSLVLRLRTSIHNNSNGTKPEFIINGVWTADDNRRIMIVVNKTKMTIYVDSLANDYHLSLGPEISFFNLVKPSFMRSVCLGETGLWPAKIIYWSVLMLPIVLLFLLLYAGNQVKHRRQ